MGMTGMIKTHTRRGPNQLFAHARKYTSADGTRRVYGRNVKRSLGDRRFDAVYVWRLAERKGNKWVTISQHRDEQSALAFLGRSSFE